MLPGFPSSTHARAAAERRFESSTRHRTAIVNERLTALEHKIAFLEAAMDTVPQ